jgi:hypothetical protein
MPQSEALSYKQEELQFPSSRSKERRKGKEKEKPKKSAHNDIVIPARTACPILPTDDNVEEAHKPKVFILV